MGLNMKLTHTILYRIALCFVMAGITVGCATTGQQNSPAYDPNAEALDEFYEFEPVPPTPVLDPFQPVNRVVHTFNDRAYVWVLDPVAYRYSKMVPLPVRRSLERAIINIKAPIRIANSAFQIRFGKAGEELRRFVVNSTWGVAGLTDPAAKKLGWEAPSPEDFGQTLGHYGVGPGFPLVLPFLGPSNVRDFIGRYPDYYLYHLPYVLNEEEVIAHNIAEQINYISLNQGAYESLVEDATDPYILLRDTYDQRRRSLIEEGWDQPEGIPAEAEAAKAEAQADIEQLLVYLQSTEISRRQKRSGVTATLNDAADLRLLAKLCLGKQEWEKLNRAEQEEYINAFSNMLGGYLFTRLSFFRVQSVEFGDPVPLNLPGQPKYRVPLNAVANGIRTEISMYYALRGDEWKLYDLEVLGVSVRETFRGQYARFLEENTFEALLEDIREE